MSKFQQLLLFCSFLAILNLVLSTDEYNISRISYKFVEGKCLKPPLSKLNCMPRDVLMPLNITEPHILMVPDKVMVKRCDAYESGQKACLPTKTREIHIPVHKYDLTKKKYCGTVVVVQHVECKRKCLLSKKNCNQNEKFDNVRCACVCKNSQQQNHCHHNKIWNPSTCSCVCRDPQECSTGTEWSHVLCRCMRIENSEDIMISKRSLKKKRLG